MPRLPDVVLLLALLVSAPALAQGDGCVDDSPIAQLLKFLEWLSGDVPVETAPDPEPFLETVGSPVEHPSEDTPWLAYNTSSYHCEGCGYGDLDDSQARDYTVQGGTTAGLPVYSIADAFDGAPYGAGEAGWDEDALAPVDMDLLPPEADEEAPADEAPPVPEAPPCPCGAIHASAQ